MKPVAIFRCANGDGPGMFAEFLDLNKISWVLYALDKNELVPKSSKDFSGIAIMGGPMSVNDDIAWIPDILNLIRDAISNDVPVIGHCLGGQLISKALGGTVVDNTVKEIGWNPVYVEDTETAKNWLGEDLKNFTTFQWHQQTFSIPDNAERILYGDTCANQAFVVNNKHLAMQCHVEMTDLIINHWCTGGITEINESLNSPAVQSVEDIKKEIPNLLPSLTKVAFRLYLRWIKGLQ